MKSPGTKAGIKSHIGGQPVLPPDVSQPLCTTCSKPLTFFFQIVFPPDHAWAGKGFSFFAATACAHEEYPIPTMVSGILSGCDVPEELLLSYQRNFRTFVFEVSDGIPRPDLESWIEHRPLKLTNVAASLKSWAIQSPKWIGEDETPATLADKQAQFLLQVPNHFKFQTRPGAPRQMEWMFTQAEPSHDPHYELFLGNQIYFWGTLDADPRLIYILTQK